MKTYLMKLLTFNYKRMIQRGKKKRIWIGVIFVLSSAIIYLSALLAYYFGFQSITYVITQGVIGWIFPIIGIISVITGIITLKNAKNKGIECDVRDAESKKKFSQKLSEILSRERLHMVLLGVVVLAFSVNVVELLCSFVIPTTFTAKIIALQLSVPEALSAIFIYDLAYILDDVVVLSIALYTMSMKFFSEKWILRINIFAGTLLIIIGLAL